MFNMNTLKEAGQLKKIIAFCGIIAFMLMLIVLYLLSSQIAMANSGPTYWQGYPSSEVLAVDENCPIEVEGENLVFDFSGNSSVGYNIGGQVKASYEMINPINKDLTVQMAFPLVSSLKNFSPGNVAIIVDGKYLPYDLYIGDVASSNVNYAKQENAVSFDFKDILSTVSNQTYQAEHFSEYEKGKLYTLDVKPTTEKSINFAVDFEIDMERTRVLTNGFNGYERSGQKVRISAWCNQPETLEIFLLGDDIDFYVTAYTDGELKQKTDLFTYNIQSEEGELRPYIMDYVKSYKEAGEQLTGDLEAFNEDQLYNLYGAALDRALTTSEGYCSLNVLIEQKYYDRVLTLVYAVDFPANSKRNVTVSYKATGTMDKTETEKPVYTFDYILNPALSWRKFGNLDIEIITPEEAPNIVESSIEFAKENDRHYRASLSSLPKEDLTFSIYEDEKISPLSKTYKNFRPVRSCVPILSISNSNLPGQQTFHKL